MRRRLRHRWTDLFQLVAALEKYPEFVPACQRTRVLSRTADGPDRTIIVSRMTVGYGAARVSYANRTVADLAKRQVTVNAIDGPLRRLDVLWTFQPDGSGATTEVGFAVTYEFSNPILAALATGVFDSMFRQILAAFERRADQLFSTPTAAGEPPPPAAASSPGP
jgi:coenzyme Q-binding protein COQ10